MMGLRSQEVLCCHMEHKIITHPWQMVCHLWEYLNFSVSFFPNYTPSVVRVCPLSKVHGTFLSSVLHYFKEVP